MSSDTPPDDGRGIVGLVDERLLQTADRVMGPLQPGETIRIYEHPYFGGIVVEKTAAPSAVDLTDAVAELPRRPESERRTTAGPKREWWRMSLVIALASGSVVTVAVLFLTTWEWAASLVAGAGFAILVFLLVFFRNPDFMMRRTFRAALIATVCLAGATIFKIKLNWLGLAFEFDVKTDWVAAALVAVALVISGVLAYQERKGSH